MLGRDTLSARWLQTTAVCLAMCTGRPAGLAIVLGLEEHGRLSAGVVAAWPAGRRLQERYSLVASPELGACRRRLPLRSHQAAKAKAADAAAAQPGHLQAAQLHCVARSAAGAVERSQRAAAVGAASPLLPAGAARQQRGVCAS